MDRKLTKAETNATTYQQGRIPPQSRDAEAAVLGLMLLEAQSVDQVLPLLTIDDFYVDAHARVYNAMVKLHLKGGMIDLLTLTDEMRKTDDLEVVGGPYFLTKLTMDIVTGANLMAWVLIIKEQSIKRSIIKIAGKLYTEGYEPSCDALDILSKAQLELSKIQDSFKSQKMSKIADVAIQVLSEMEEASTNDSPYLGLQTGLNCLDKITLGLSAPDFIIMAGGTGEGKSTLALQVCMEIGISGHPAAFFSLEMKNRQLIWKVFSSLIEEEVTAIRKGKLSEDKWRLLHQVLNDKLLKTNIWMHDQGGLTIEELCSIIRSLVAKQGVKIVFVDYLQLVRSTQKFGTREGEVGYVSRTFKALAMELNTPIVALSQLSRIEKGSKRLYKLSDLRESGSIEQDADGVIFVWRPSYHDVEKLKPTDLPFAEDDVLFQIEKWRLGQTGHVKAKFNGRFSRFEDIETFPGFKPMDQAISEMRPFSGYAGTTTDTPF